MQSLFLCKVYFARYQVPLMLWRSKLALKHFKENIHKIFWGCLLLPVWNAVVNMV